MKECFKCKISKPISDFYKHPKMADGHLGKCKECTKKDVRNHRFENDSVREYDRKRGNRRSYAKTKEYREKNPKKYAAHLAVGNALRVGDLVKPESCECCESNFALNAHHDDYNFPLKVRWLCSKCHHRWHAENGEAVC
jgi:hypothetical protein